MDQKSNGIARAEDFKKLAQAGAWEEAERIVLPASGLAVMLRRPRPQAFVLLGRPLPQSLAAKLQQEGGFAQATAEELVEFSRFWTQVFQQMFIAPRLSLEPGPDEIHPGWIPEQDQIFLMRWAVGEVASDGRDLAAFRGERRPAAPGADGGDVALAPIGTPEVERGSLPD